MLPCKHLFFFASSSHNPSSSFLPTPTTTSYTSLTRVRITSRAPVPFPQETSLSLPRLLVSCLVAFLILAMDRTNGAGATAAGAYAVPPPVPVPVASAVVPIDFTVVKKRLGGGGGGDMAVHDASGGLAFRVAAAADGGARGRSLLDAAGDALVTVRSSEGEYQAFRGISSEQRDIIFTAKVIFASSNRKELHVFAPPRSTFEDPKPSYRLIGNTFRRACTIIKGNSIVAQTNLLYKLKKVIYSRCKFRVTIYPGNDNILTMAMIIAFFVDK